MEFNHRKAQLRVDWKSAALSNPDAALAAYAETLTKTPGLAATLVVSYFNFVNRMVLGLGVSLEDDPGGYKFD